jgi:hypothetical protein
VIFVSGASWRSAYVILRAPVSPGPTKDFS